MGVVNLSLSFLTLIFLKSTDRLLCRIMDIFEEYWSVPIESVPHLGTVCCFLTIRLRLIHLGRNRVGTFRDVEVKTSDVSNFGQ